MDTANNATEYFNRLNPKATKQNCKVKCWLLEQLHKVGQDLRPHNISLIRIGWHGVWNMADYMWMIAREIVEAKTGIEEHVEVNRVASYVFYTDFHIGAATENGKMYLYFSFKDNLDRKKVVAVFKTHFGNAFKWSGDVDKAMTIIINAIF